MSILQVRLSTGQRIAVRFPSEVTIDPPRPVQQVRYAFAVSLAKQIEPHIQRRPDVRQVLRDQSGRITGLAEFTGDPTRRPLAWQAATQLIDTF